MMSEEADRGDGGRGEGGIKSEQGRRESRKGPGHSVSACDLRVLWVPATMMGLTRCPSGSSRLSSLQAASSSLHLEFMEHQVLGRQLTSKT